MATIKQSRKTLQMMTLCTSHSRATKPDHCCFPATGQR